jgi:hypothetical protein
MLFSLLESEGNAVNQLLDPYHTEARRSIMKQHREIYPPVAFSDAPRIKPIGNESIFSRKSTPARWGSAPRFSRFLSEE